MNNKNILLNFFNLDKPTTKQIIEVLKIMIKDNLMITTDNFEINSLTGEKTKKISTTPTVIDLITDEIIIRNIVKDENSKLAVVAQPQIDKLKLDNKLL